MSQLTLTLLEPAYIGDRPRDDFVLSTRDYLPGSAVRGAFAGAWLARHGPSEPGTPERKAFTGLFEGGVRFGTLLRADAEPASLAVIGHKYEPLDTCEVVDYDRAAGDQPPPYCSKCWSPIERLTAGRAEVRRRTSVAIGADGVAVRGQLFTRETLPEGTVFRGTLIADQDLAATLEALGPIRVGGRRTTHGLAQVAIDPAVNPPGAERRGEDHLILRLRSPGIFTDDNGYPSRDPSPSELRAALGCPAHVVRRWFRWHQDGGWHMASGLPKPSELAVAAGSTYLIMTERRVDDPQLNMLARRGVGLRRHEGFGDLAPPPKLRRGKLAGDAENQHRRELMDKAAPLRRLEVQFPASWPRLAAAFTGHASGDRDSADTLRRVAASHPDADVRAAIEVFLGLPAGDAAYVAGELGSHGS
jgi:CRISPR-associated protein Csx10